MIYKKYISKLILIAWRRDRIEFKMLAKILNGNPEEKLLKTISLGRAVVQVVNKIRYINGREHDLTTILEGNGLMCTIDSDIVDIIFRKLSEISDPQNLFHFFQKKRS